MGERVVSFPIPLASKMSGTSVGQLAHWRKTGVLVTEIENAKPPYSLLLTLILVTLPD